MTRSHWTLTPLVLLVASCAGKLPDTAPPLADMVEPLELFAEPDDEAERQQLPLGSFTGAYVTDARDSLEAMLGDAQGVSIERIVENSPADAAALRAGDLLLEARFDDGAARAVRYPSDWRAIELACQPGAEIEVVFDRANRRSKTVLHPVARVHPTERAEVERLREEDKVGVVLRTATEVEARSADMAPGGGAVIVGLSKNSPWRKAQMAFGDLLVEVDGQTVAHPEVVLDAIRAADDEMTVAFVRAGERHQVRTPLTRRAQETHEIFVPLLFSYESDRGRTETSVLLGIFNHRTTAAAWNFRLLWFIHFGGGDADQLLEVDR